MGDLLTYLRNSREKEENNLNFEFLIKISYYISSGCEYLESINLVHRDISARNCLLNIVSFKNNEFVLEVKLGDFGLARNIYFNDFYRTGGDKALPIRWMAPESLQDGLFTSKSDVW